MWKIVSDRVINMLKRDPVKKITNYQHVDVDKPGRKYMLIWYI